jgi:hypothetical protein
LVPVIADAHLPAFLDAPFAGLVARGLADVKLLRLAGSSAPRHVIAATLPGTNWQHGHPSRNPSAQDP